MDVIQYSYISPLGKVVTGTAADILAALDIVLRLAADDDILVTIARDAGVVSAVSCAVQFQ